MRSLSYQDVAKLEPGVATLKEKDMGKVTFVGMNRNQDIVVELDDNEIISIPEEFFSQYEFKEAFKPKLFKFYGNEEDVDTLERGIVGILTTSKHSTDLYEFAITVKEIDSES